VVSRGKNMKRVKRYAMDIWSSSNLRKISEKKILLDSELQETENIMTTLQSKIHYNTVTIIHVNP
jgi:hypothetical protein